jgi:hypothetical protein
MNKKTNAPEPPNQKPPVEEAPPFISEDPSLTGILIAKGHKVIPEPDARQRVHYCIYGDVQKSLKEIYENRPIGAVDVLNGIKAARTMLWTFRQGGR